MPDLRARRLRGLARDEPAARLLARLRARVPDHGRSLHRERLVVAEAALRPGAAREGPLRPPVLPSLRDPPLVPRGRPGVPGGHGPLGHRTLPVDGAGPSAPRPARLDDHPVDPSGEPADRSAGRPRILGGPPRLGARGRAGLGGGGPVLLRPSGGRGAISRLGPLGPPLLTPLRRGRPRAGKVSHRARRLRDGRGRYGVRPRRPQLRSRRPAGGRSRAGRGVRPARQPGGVRRGRPSRAGEDVQGGGPPPRRGPRRAGPALPFRDDPAHLPVLLAVRYPAPLPGHRLLVRPYLPLHAGPPAEQRRRAVGSPPTCGRGGSATS